MRAREFTLAFAVAVCAVGVGCKKKTGAGDTTAAGTTGAGTTGTAPVAAAHPVGMVDPFAHLTSDGVKALNAGYAALKAKKYDDAQTEFAKVTAATPDYTAAWYQQVRAAALGGHLDQALNFWNELLARDYVGYAGKLDKPSDLKALRAAPEWAQFEAAEAQYKTAYADRLADDKGGKGFFFVARAHELGKPKPGKLPGGQIVDLKQEIYYYDLTTQKYRRLSETGGHVYAINRSPDKKVIAYFTTTGLDGGDVVKPFSNPKGGSIDLTTLETTGPYAIGGQDPEITFMGTHDPLWLANAGAKQSCFDTARTAIIDCPNVPKDVREKSSDTSSDADSVSYSTPGAVSDVKIDSAGTSITVPGYDQPLRAARPIPAASLAWSPTKKRLSYSGAIDSCQAIKDGKAAKKNELFVFDADKKTVTRIANAVATFETLWLDDDHLVYEGGVGKGGRLHLYDFTNRSDIALAPRAGAGLYGYPMMLCEPGEGEGDGPGPEGSEDAPTDGNTPAN